MMNWKAQFQFDCGTIMWLICWLNLALAGICGFLIGKSL